MTFVPNPAFEREFAAEPLTRAAMLATAEALAETAKGIAPGTEGKTIAPGEDAEGALVANHSHAGHLIEWGSINNPPYAPLRRATSALGMTLRETTKP